MAHDGSNVDDDWLAVDAAFQQALEQGEGVECVEWVQNNVDLPPAIRDKVLALLADDEPSEAAMAAAIEQRDSLFQDAGDESTAAGIIGSRIGDYRVTKLIASGGMGAVYLAERADGQWQQTVAIKILPSWANDPKTVARLRAERQILSNLQHPNITQLLGGGETADGFPYLITEFIDGVPITQYVDENRLGLDARLTLFCAVADAVHHAHRNLVIHRDIKPSNILVDKDGRPHLLDFGIAKLLEPEAGDDINQLTATGFTPMTLRFASPEQLAGDDVTTASDIYQLGLLLHRLLTGHYPDREAEQRSGFVSSPSSMLAPAQAQPDDDGPTVVRRAELRGDLDTILLKALRGSPSERYASAAALVEDIRRFQAGAAITAKRESAIDIAKRLSRRNPFAAIAVVTIVALVAAWLVSLQIYSNELEHERDFARQQAARAERVKVLLIDLYRRNDPLEADTIGGKPLTVWDSLDAAAAKTATQLSAEPDIQAELFSIFGVLYNSAGRQDKAIEMNRAALKLYESMGADWNAARAATESELGGLLMNTEKTEAMLLLQRALDSVPSIRDANPHEAILVLLDAAVASHEAANRDRALQYYQQAQEIYDEADLDDASLELEILFGYGNTLIVEDRLVEAESALLEAMRIGEDSFDSGHARLNGVLSALSSLERNRGNLDKSIEYSNRVVARMETSRADNYENLLTARNNLALALAKARRYQEGADMMRDVVARRRELSPAAGSANLATSLKNLATILNMAGENEEALGHAQEAQKLMELHLPADSAYQATPHFTMALIYLDTGKASMAAESARRSLDMLLQTVGPNYYQTSINRCILGEALLRQGALEESRELVGPALTALLEAETRVPRYANRCRQTYMELQAATP